jgi:hypothetical protein
MEKILLLFSIALILPRTVFSQQAKTMQVAVPKSTTTEKTIERKSHVYTDTSEHTLVRQTLSMMNKAKTIMDAQVISKKSYWHYVKDTFLPSGGAREIYTVITFRVFHWIKGSIGGNEVTFYQAGGKIGDTAYVVTPEHIYSLNERAIFFLANTKPNTYLLDRGRVEIFGSSGGVHGEIFVGTHSVAPRDYVRVLRKTVTDSTVYKKYIHAMKARDEEIKSRKLKYQPYGWMPADSVHREVLKEAMKQVRRDTTNGGVK